jgi:hypothetical protein
MGSIGSMSDCSSFSAFELLTRRDTGQARSIPGGKGASISAPPLPSSHASNLLGGRKTGIQSWIWDMKGLASVTISVAERIRSPFSRSFHVSHNPAQESTPPSIAEMKKGCLPSSI